MALKFSPKMKLSGILKEKITDVNLYEYYLIRIVPLNERGEICVKKFKILLVLVVIAGGVFAYFQHKQTKMHEFMTYHNDIWVPTVAETEHQLKDLIGKTKESENNDEMRKLSNMVEEEGLPVIQKSLKKFQEVDLKNKEIKKLNQKTIETEESRIIVLKTLRDYGKDEQIFDAVQHAEEKMKEKTKETVDYKQELMDKYNLEEVTTEKVRGVKKIKPK